MDAAKDQAKLGIVSMGGLVGMGALSSLTPYGGGVMQTASAGLQLANIGQMAKTGKITVGEFAPKTKKGKKDKLYDKIWG